MFIERWRVYGREVKGGAMSLAKLGQCWNAKLALVNISYYQRVVINIQLKGQRHMTDIE